MKEKMLARLEDREKVLQARLSKIRRRIEQGKIGGEEDRLWLDGFAVGVGLDICCGDFPIRNANGVDGDQSKLGAAYFGQGDNLPWTDSESQDFVVTNYFDSMPSVLGALNEWWRILKPGGTLALVCCNAEKYEGALGPLTNAHRLQVYTRKTVECYLSRARFSDIEILDADNVFRVSCKKPLNKKGPIRK